MPVPAPLSADALFKLVRQTFAQVPEHRPMHIAISLGDALSANASHIQELQRHYLHFILGVKPGDHAYLFACCKHALVVGGGHSMRTDRPLPAPSQAPVPDMPEPSDAAAAARRSGSRRCAG